MNQAYPIFKTLGEGPPCISNGFLRKPKVNILDGSRETLVLLRIVVLEANLKVNSLSKLTLLVSGSRKYGLNALVESFFWNLTHGCRM